jgi:SPP1 family phage portal protein
MYVTASNTDITTMNIKTWISTFVSDILPRYVKLDKYYEGKDFLNKIQTELDKANKREINNIHSNLARMIVSNACGYFIGKPVTYAFEDTQFEKEAKALFWVNDEQAENQTLAKIASRYGVAYEIMGVDTDGSLYIKDLSPLNTFFVVDDSILKRKICAITFWTRKLSNGQVKTQGYVYSKDSIRPFHGEGGIIFDEEETNPFKPCIPVFEYKNNDEEVGDYEPVLELLSAYSKLLSSNFDDVDSVANSILALINARLNKDEADELKKSRVLELMGENTDIRYLNKQLDKSYVEYLRNALRQDIFSITNIPDLTDEQFAGNQSGVAISYKLLGFENLRLTKKNYFEKGLFQRLTCLKNYRKFNEKAEQIPEGQVTITFQVNLPSNIDKDNQIAKLYTTGVLSLETTLELLESVDDVKEEQRRLDAEKPSLEELASV